jgi:hypothetical protein
MTNALFLSFPSISFCHSERSEESSVDASLRLRSVQHDKRGVIPSALFCHSERSEESSMDASLRLRSVQHDKVVSFRTLFFVIPSAVRNPVHGCFASLSMTSAVSFRALFFVIPSESEESRAWMLRFAQHHRVVMSSTFVIFTQF